MSNTQKKKLDIDIIDAFGKNKNPSLIAILGVLMNRIFAIDQLNQKYAQISLTDNSYDFIEKVLETLNITYELSDTDLAKIPSEGPVMVMANHPFGAIEGIILTAILGSVRRDLKFLGNYLLQHISELKDILISVDPFGDSLSTKTNIRPIMESIRWLRDGGMLVVFPAGEVSHIDLRHFQIIDPEWSASIPRIIRNTGAPVLPIYFQGNNGPLFQMVGLLHPILRTAMLPRELLNKTNKCIRVRIGNLIPFKKLHEFATNKEMIHYLRTRTYFLKNRNEKKEVKVNPIFLKKVKKETFEPIVPAQDSKAMATEISQIPDDQLLLESGEYAVYYANAPQISLVLQEIGRLRETTFRAYYEGTGKSIDLDPFDQYYIHLFLWNRDKKEVIGAYRLGKVDEIVAKQGGKKGLYTSTLFEFKQEFLKQLNPSLELGRSFIRSECQKSYSPLLILWKGISSFILKNKHYKILFGPVSINKKYGSLSRQLMVTFLQQNDFLPDFARMVKPKKEFKTSGNGKISSFSNKGYMKNIDEISSLIAGIEFDQKGVPILLKQYLKLGGKLIGLNIDEQFSNVLDALIVVDLTQTEPRILERYMGREGAKDFLEYHESVDFKTASIV